MMLFGGMVLIHGHNGANPVLKSDSRVTQQFAYVLFRRRRAQADQVLSEFYTIATAKYWIFNDNEHEEHKEEPAAHPLNKTLKNPRNHRLHCSAGFKGSLDAVLGIL